MRVHIAITESAGRASASLEIVQDALQLAGVRPQVLALPAAGLPPGSEPITFKATVPELAESWRLARHVEAMTSPGDLVVMSDRNGVGAVCAWEQAMLPARRARRLAVVGADSRFLATMAVAGTARGFGLDDVVGLEVSAYRFADLVLVTSEWAAALLEGLARSVHLAVVPETRTPSRRPTGAPTSAWLPEAVGRPAQTRAILSALVATGARVTLSDRDEEDRFWKGTTWEVLAPVLERMGGGVVRASSPPPEVDTVILGELVGVPDQATRAVHRQEVRVVVPAGSTAAALWPDAETWKDQRHLEEVLRSPARVPRPVPEFHLPPPDTVELSDRARRVSVGVPVFRTVDYLDECIESILAQTQLPAELLLYDDGSESEAVTSALEDWSRREPDLIRIMSGPNAGVCVARNRMLEAMTGDAFLLIDSDDRVAPTFIEACADGLRANEDLVAVATWTEFFGEYEGVEAKMPFDAMTAWDENPIISTCVVVDMVARDQGVRFSPDLAWIYCEDWEFWAKLLAGGGRFGLVPKPLAFHRAAPASGGGYRRTELAYGVGRARARHFLRRVDEIVP